MVHTLCCLGMAQLLHATLMQRVRKPCMHPPIECYACRSCRTSFCNQVNVLLKRCLVSYSRNPANATGRVLMATVLGIVSGVAFINIGTGAALTPACVPL